MPSASQPRTAPPRRCPPWHHRQQTCASTHETSVEMTDPDPAARPSMVDGCRRIRFDLSSPLRARGHERFLRVSFGGFAARRHVCSFCCARVFVWSLACFPVIRGEGSGWLPVLLPRPRFGRSRRRVSLLCSAPLNFVTVAVRTAHTSGGKRKWSKLSRELVWMRV